MGSPRSRRPAGSFHRNDRAVVDLPLKLLVTAVVLALTVPAGFKTLQSFGRDAAEREAAASMAKLEAAGHQVLGAGAGTSVTVRLDFSGSGVASIEYARAGANLSSDPGLGPVLTFKVTERPERRQVTEPNVFFMHKSGLAAEFTRGTYLLQLTHKTVDLGGATPTHYAEIDYLQS